MWIALDITSDKSTLVQVMAWCRQAPSHCLNQYCRRSVSSYGLTRPRWVKNHIRKSQMTINWHEIGHGYHLRIQASNISWLGIRILYKWWSQWNICILGHTWQIIVISMAMSRDGIPFMPLGHSCDGCTGGAKQVGMPARFYLTNRSFSVCQLISGCDRVMMYYQY